MVPRKGATIILDPRWVLKWKLMDGKKSVKARLVMRGFKCQQAEDLLTAASTASRWVQRVVNVGVVEHNFRLFSFDVSSAFLQGWTFEEILKRS